jgi:hypothetical protein
MSLDLKCRVDVYTGYLMAITAAEFECCATCVEISELGELGDSLSAAIARGNVEYFTDSIDDVQFNLGWRIDWAIELAAIHGHRKLVELLASKKTNLFEPELAEAIVQHVATHGRADMMALVAALSPHPFDGAKCPKAMAAATSSGQVAAMELVRRWCPPEHRRKTYAHGLAAAANRDRPAIMRLLVGWGASFEAAIEHKIAVNKFVADRRITPLITRTWGTLEERNSALARLRLWQTTIAREEQYAKMLGMLIPLRPLALPTYPLLWVLEYAAPGPLAELERVRLIVRVMAHQI